MLDTWVANNVLRKVIIMILSYEKHAMNENSFFQHISHNELVLEEQEVLQVALQKDIKDESKELANIIPWLVITTKVPQFQPPTLMGVLDFQNCKVGWGGQK